MFVFKTKIEHIFFYTIVQLTTQMAHEKGEVFTGV